MVVDLRPLFVDAGALFLVELVLAVRAVELPRRVAQLVVAIEAIFALRAGDPEDARHKISLGLTSRQCTSLRSGISERDDVV
jgi:hypothetical protein